MIMNRHTYDNSGFIIDYNVKLSLCSIQKTRSLLYSLIKPRIQ